MKNEQLEKRINNTMFMSGGNTDVEKDYFKLGAYAGIEIMRELALGVLNENYVAAKSLTDEDKARTAQDILLETYEDLIAIFSSNLASENEVSPERTVNDMTDEECLKGSEIVGGASHLSPESQIHQFRQLFEDLFWRQTNISGSSWFKLYAYFKSINVSTEIHK